MPARRRIRDRARDRSHFVGGVAVPAGEHANGAGRDAEALEHLAVVDARAANSPAPAGPPLDGSTRGLSDMPTKFCCDESLFASHRRTNYVSLEAGRDGEGAAGRGLRYGLHGDRSQTHHLSTLSSIQMLPVCSMIVTISRPERAVERSQELRTALDAIGLPAEGND